MRFYTSALLLAGLTTAHQANPTATIAAGVIVGTTTSLPSAPAAVHKYLGVPFAAPPTRFQPPRGHGPWARPRTTQTRKPACVQEFPCT
jgi:carboxylesterase type B